VQGIDSEEYVRSFLLPFRPLDQILQKCKEMGIAKQEDTRWHLTPKGMLVSNSILTELLLAQEHSTPLARR
ncbi:MAG: coproporphyrinogen III oxidase, partial [Oscillospiraceae bacterium]|nr:coproporphyrinogen III oxidase [Oscillospiraceae bacterium]